MPLDHGTNSVGQAGFEPRTLPGISGVLCRMSFWPRVGGTLRVPSCGTLRVPPTLVAQEGLEPSRRVAATFEIAVFTAYTTGPASSGGWNRTNTTWFRARGSPVKLPRKPSCAVEMVRFELTSSCSRSRRALRYPTSRIGLLLSPSCTLLLPCCDRCCSFSSGSGGRDRTFTGGFKDRQPTVSRLPKQSGKRGTRTLKTLRSNRFRDGCPHQ